MPPRTTYRHGDLRRALLEAGTAMAREGGPEAVVLREATRRAGVAPNAAYRHFADRQALLAAVCAVAQTQVAIAMETEQSTLPPAADHAEAARARLRAIGVGYLRFAQSEPELFRTAFSVPLDMTDAAAPNRAGPSGLTPFQLLSSALDGLVEAGVLSRERRHGAEFLAWSAVHGLATLETQGPLRMLGDEFREAIGQRVLDMIENGL
ncbi:regulatory protein, tetR family [Amycolatopsis xylanica]|uniref:Regulatory protein, tetR family n=1 Tax=Amycolatopsis xylanica TaxID=589385 RepID=A0A1H3QT80_9PSEU|nr:TetR-like C-terminal domain-containing protein [Amycolatopsis xylanica]SDZ16215.1 regulatory protein, tetR family [Amycolatopsis xylanica]